ncbi:unnamed protein product [Ixodes hexagonus]
MGVAPPATTTPHSPGPAESLEGAAERRQRQQRQQRGPLPLPLLSETAFGWKQRSRRATPVALCPGPDPGLGPVQGIRRFEGSAGTAGPPTTAAGTRPAARPTTPAEPGR